MKSLLCMALIGAAAAAGAQPTADPARPPMVEVRTAASAPVATGASENFSGTVRISTPFQAQPRAAPAAPPSTSRRGPTPPGTRIRSARR
ncbi:MAG TPA: hypothetical protein PLO41_08615 [Rubrivivax sp.]|nr:hypothetical protein [Rubrivivax sp.]